MRTLPGPAPGGRTNRGVMAADVSTAAPPSRSGGGRPDRLCGIRSRKCSGCGIFFGAIRHAGVRCVRHEERSVDLRVSVTRNGATYFFDTTIPGVKPFGWYTDEIKVCNMFATPCRMVQRCKADPDGRTFLRQGESDQRRWGYPHLHRLIHRTNVSLRPESPAAIVPWSRHPPTETVINYT